MDAKTLHDAISQVCPITGVGVPVWDDRTTWKYTPKPEATTEQLDAAENVVETIPIGSTSGILITAEWISRFTNAEYLKLEQKRAADISAGKTNNFSKDWDIVVSAPAIYLARQKVQTLKTQLVTDLVLTQARADAIFS